INAGGRGAGWHFAAGRRGGYFYRHDHQYPRTHRRNRPAARHWQLTPPAAEFVSRRSGYSIPAGGHYRHAGGAGHITGSVNSPALFTSESRPFLLAAIVTGIRFHRINSLPRSVISSLFIRQYYSFVE